MCNWLGRNHGSMHTCKRKGSHSAIIKSIKPKNINSIMYILMNVRWS